jgi:hypothetical protein
MTDNIKIDQNLLKVSHYKKDWIPIEHSLELDSEVTLTITAQVSDIQYSTNHDGTADRIHVLKGLYAEK